MTTPEAQEAAMKERIVNHMNRDHADSVRRYLEAFKQKSFYQVRDARLTDITLNGMKLSCGGQQFIIPFDPPMKALREARERLVSLDADARQALGRSDITINKYISPYTPGLGLFHPLNFTVCLITWVAFSRAANFKSGSMIHDNLLSHVPGFKNFCLAVQPIILGIMVVIHTVEAVLMARKLTRHGLTPLDSTWWAWVLSCFNEGWSSFLRVDSVIEEKKKEKEAKKH